MNSRSLDWSFTIKGWDNNFQERWQCLPFGCYESKLWIYLKMPLFFMGSWKYSNYITLSCTYISLSWKLIWSKQVKIAITGFSLKIFVFNVVPIFPTWQFGDSSLSEIDSPAAMLRFFSIFLTVTGNFFLCENYYSTSWLQTFWIVDVS